MTEENAFEFQIHYHLNQEDLHQMDARVFNECERQLLDAFDIVKTFTGGYNIEIAPKKKGGLIEILVIPAITIIGYETVKNLFDALIQNSFLLHKPSSPIPKIELRYLKNQKRKFNEGGS